MTTRDERFRAWRKLSFGNDEAWRRADMADIDPPQERTGFWCIGCQAEHEGEPAASIGDCHHCRDCQVQWEETMREVEEHDARIADAPHVRMLCR